MVPINVLHCFIERDSGDIPCEWKDENGLDPDDLEAGLAIDEEPGYMLVEIYFNSLAPAS